jgi:uncharacterized radical SAM superfamily protein
MAKGDESTNIESLSADETLKKCFEAPLDSLGPLFDRARRISDDRFSKTLHCYVPGMVHYNTPYFKSTPQCFPSVSITGTECKLNCKHCRGKLLERMAAGTTPQALYEACVEIKKSGAEGCLISGGSLKDGSVPLMDFIPEIKRVKQELGLKIVVHTGIVYPQIAEALADAGIDAAMLDIIGAQETAKEVYHLECDIVAFEESITLLEKNNIPIAPHIIVGLHYGQVKGEREALAMLARHRPTVVVIIAFMPLEGTPMHETNPSTPEEIARVTLASRLLMPETPLLLGCARPAGMHKIETDIWSIKAGVDGIAFPSEDACEFAEELGLDIKFHQRCCSLLWQED